MSLGKIIIFIMTLTLVIGCEKAKQQNKKTDTEHTSNNNGTVTPERVYIKVSEEAKYYDDFNESIKAGDFRFVGVLEFSLVVPEVMDYYEKYSRSNGVKIIEGTSDSYDLVNDPLVFQKKAFYTNYAKSYNTLLLRYLTSGGD